MNNYNAPYVQNIYMQMLSQCPAPLSEDKEALLFAKALQYQNVQNPNSIVFCPDNQFFVSRTPTGYAVTGFYDIMNPYGAPTRVPFNVTVNKFGGVWAPSAKYVGADTKAGSNFIATWILLMVGCSLVGLLSYFVLTAIIG